MGYSVRRSVSLSQRKHITSQLQRQYNWVRRNWSPFLLRIAWNTHTHTHTHTHTLYTKCGISSALRSVAHNLTIALNSLNIARPVALTYTPYSIQQGMTFSRHRLIPQSGLRRVHSLFPSDFSIQYDL